MCTVITLQRPGHAWPLLLAANRDERLDRAWDAPGAFWPDQPGVIGGRDRLGDGTWMATDARVVAAVLNRPGSLGPAAGKRSRGELPLLALRHGTAAEAARAIARLNGLAYRSFNMIVADRSAVWFVRNDEAGALTAVALPPGLHMTTAHDPNDLASARTARHLPRFAAATPPEPPEWQPWQSLLGDESGPAEAALSVPDRGGFGTACASLLAIAASGAAHWMFAPGPAAHTGFAPVDLTAPGRRVAGGAAECYTAAITRG